MEHDHAAMLASLATLTAHPHNEAQDAHTMPGHPGHSMIHPPDHHMPSHPHPNPTTPMCKMNMIWDWSYPQDMCVVFPSWQIRSRLDFYLYTLLIILAGAGFEWLRLYLVTYDAQLALSAPPAPPAARRTDDLPSPASSSASSVAQGLLTNRHQLVPPLYIKRSTQVRRAMLHGVRVALSFWLMLVFMTYNVYLAAAVILGTCLMILSFSPPLPSLAMDLGLVGGIRWIN